MEYVVLVDDHNNPIGTRLKETVHTNNTPLHRGFSVFLFNDKKQVLLTKRAITKKTFAGMWTNSVCGHPAPDETVVDAAKRRMHDELGYNGVVVKEISPYRYRFSDKNGIVENEICPILIGHVQNDPMPNNQEVDEWKWIDWNAFLTDIRTHPSIYSPWCREEAEIVNNSRMGKKETKE